MDKNERNNKSVDDENNVDYDYLEYLYSVDLETEKPDERPADDLVFDRRKTNIEKANAARMEIYDWIQCVMAALLFVILLFVFIGRVIGVQGTSMVGTLYNGDKVVMSNLFYTPKYKDIIVLKTDYFADIPLVKRVIATEGQTVDIDFEAGEVYVDGQLLVEDYLDVKTTLMEDFHEPITIPDGFVFVMGDNRNASTDSRSDKVGLIDTREILGKVYWVIFPGADDAGNRNWKRIGSVY